MIVAGGIVKEVSRIIAEHLRKPENLATLERCLEKWLGYEYWLQIKILNALSEAGLHPDHLEMFFDAPCGLTRPCKPGRSKPEKWCDWVLYARKEQEYLWVELKTVPSAVPRGEGSKIIGKIREDMRCLDLFSLQETVRQWERPPLKRSKYLMKKAASLRQASHRGVCILSGTTDLETQVPRDEPIWGPPDRYEIGGQFALWVWERVLPKGL